MPRATIYGVAPRTCMKQERSLLFRATLFYVPDFEYQRTRSAIIRERHSDINCIIIAVFTPPLFPSVSTMKE